MVLLDAFLSPPSQDPQQFFPSLAIERYALGCYEPGIFKSTLTQAF